MNTSITYKGEVTITIKNKKYVARNNGSYKLFNLIVELLKGTTLYTRPAKLPKYFGIVNSASEVNTLMDNLLKSATYSPGSGYSSILNRTIPTATTTVQADNDSTVPNITFEAVLTEDMFSVAIEDASNWTQTCLVLLSGDKTDIIAVVPLTGEEVGALANIKGGVEALVRWTLTFDNKEVD